MPANEKLTGAESASVTKTKAVKTKIAGKFKAGDKIKLPCVVVNVTDTEITLEVEDGRGWQQPPHHVEPGSERSLEVKVN